MYRSAYASRAATATIALVAVGCLMISGASADPVKDGWVTEVRLGAPSPLPVTDEAKAKGSEKKAADDAAGPTAAKRTSVDGTKDLFQPDPQYGEGYNAQGQVDIYGAKRVVDPPRPPVEIGRQQYTSGAYDESSTFLGEKNPLLPGLAVYGDWRTAVAYNSNNGKDIAQIATRLNLDVDLKITGTERTPRLLHADPGEQQ